MVFITKNDSWGLRGKFHPILSHRELSFRWTRQQQMKHEWGWIKIHMKILSQTAEMANRWEAAPKGGRLRNNSLLFKTLSWLQADSAGSHGWSWVVPKPQPWRWQTYFCKSLVIKTMRGILFISSLLLTLPKTWSSASPATSTGRYYLFCSQWLMMIMIIHIPLSL